MAESRLRLAVFIDFDNIEIGVKNTLSTQFDAGLVLEALKERGEVVSKTAYSDWQRAGDYSRLLTQHAIKMVQRNLTPGGDKNGADINLALDALEMAFTHPHINAFVIVGGDSDFISLLEKLKQYDKKVFVVGGRQFTSNIMQKNCHEFIAYENLLSSSRRQQGGRAQKPGERHQSLDRQPLEQSVPLVKRALKVLSEREVSPQLGLLKSTLLQLDSTFSERSFGAGSFRDFVEKLEKLGLVTVKQEGRDLLVELREGFEMPELPAAQDKEKSDAPAQPRAEGHGRHPHHDRAPHGEPAVAADPAKQAEGVAEMRRILAAAKASTRWPLYIRQMKQLLKTNAPGFDERAFGFATLIDLLRAAQKDGLVRMERDRQGAVRLFQGQALQAAATAAGEAQPAAEGDTPVEEAVAADAIDNETAVPSHVVDRTAEALGMSHSSPRGRRRTPVATREKPETRAEGKPEKKPVRAAKPKAEKTDKAEKAAKPKVERRRTPRKKADA